MIVSWSKYRGPGAVTFDKPRPELEKLPGGDARLQREGDDDRQVQRAGRLRPARHRERLLRRRRRRFRLLLDDRRAQGRGHALNDVVRGPVARPRHERQTLSSKHERLSTRSRREEDLPKLRELCGSTSSLPRNETAGHGSNLTWLKVR